VADGRTEHFELVMPGIRDERTQHDGGQQLAATPDELASKKSEYVGISVDSGGQHGAYDGEAFCLRAAFAEPYV
jgi:hypothetical protein